MHVENGEQFTVPDGRYLRVKASFRRSPAGESPILYEFKVATRNHPFTPYENIAPSVSAGIDLRIALPVDSVELRGTVCDDGNSAEGQQVRWRRIDQNNGTVSFGDSTSSVTTAHFDAEGIYSLVLNACDGIACSEDTVLVKVDPVNQPPVFISEPVTSASEEELYIYQAAAHDTDLVDILRYSLESAPSGMSIQPYTGYIEWTPSDTDGGDHSIIIIADDNHGGIARQDFILSWNVN